ncbi:hypothetical protein B2G69_07685 [Methylorubrum zatmanii]|nr:nucleotidyltransferase [Methylorubrum zatmanii]ARO54036.1 hypothetical protein B2G69_07685 [Methylorubrum zatmanii]
MRLSQQFEDFLRDEVNLNQTRIDLLEARVGTLKGFVEAAAWGPEILEFAAQGSWAHETIIKPSKGREFDADLLVFVDPVASWSAADYVRTLRGAFAGSGIYGDMLLPANRCVTVNYAGDFHLDVVPCVIGRPGGSGAEVCNKDDDVFEPTDGHGYAEWWEGRNAWAHHRLKHVVRLLKFLRDRKATFSVKSVLLTTLVGERITSLDAYGTDFDDVPTALRTVIGRLDDYLQANPAMPTIRNPVLWSETFDRHWDQDKYDNFRSCMNRYRRWIDDAYAEPDRTESVRKWHRVLGEDFAPEIVLEEARGVRDAVVAKAGLPNAVRDVVAAIQQFGTAVLAHVPWKLAHVEPSRWRTGGSIDVRVKCYLCSARNGQLVRQLGSGEILGRGRDLLFEAVSPMGTPFGARDFDIHWQVVNTDEAAGYAKALRGGFYKSDDAGRRWERTEYRGAHWVEAFVIRKRDKVCVGRSGRFFVVIE